MSVNTFVLSGEVKRIDVNNSRQTRNKCNGTQPQDHQSKIKAVGHTY